MVAVATDSFLSDTARPGQAARARPGGAPRTRSRLAQVSLSIGIVGLPNVGKSTLFNALTRANALASNYPFATIEPNVGIVGIPDPRLAVLAGLYDSARIVPATARFVDIAGLVRGASQGQGLGNQFLAHIRETDAICQVVRVFADPDVSHVDGDVSPGARHRHRGHRADPGRPPDPGEGSTTPRQGSEIRQEPGAPAGG